MIRIFNHYMHRRTLLGILSDLGFIVVAMIVVFAVLALLVVIFPAGLANWFDDTCFGNWFCDGASSALRSVERAWDNVGIADIRDGFSDWLRKVAGIPN